MLPLPHGLLCFGQFEHSATKHVERAGFVRCSSVPLCRVLLDCVDDIPPTCYRPYIGSARHAAGFVNYALPVDK
jgi:hypothetical protein